MLLWSISINNWIVDYCHMHGQELACGTESQFKIEKAQTLNWELKLYGNTVRTESLLNCSGVYHGK